MTLPQVWQTFGRGVQALPFCLTPLKFPLLPPKAMDFGRRISRRLLLMVCTGSLRDEGVKPFLLYSFQRGYLHFLEVTLGEKGHEALGVLSQHGQQGHQQQTGHHLPRNHPENLDNKERRHQGKSGEGCLTRNTFGSAPAAIQLSPSPPEGYLLFQLLLS